MANGDTPLIRFRKGPGKEILIGTTFVMGILYVPYVILWPILPQEGIRALPWLLP